MAVVAVADGGDSITTSWVTQLDEVTTTQKEAQLGAIRREGNKKYKYVLAADADVDPIPPGHVACYVDYEANTISGDVDDYIGTGILAGVTVASIANGSYGWVQIGGIAGTEIDTVAGAVGNALTSVGGTDGTMDVSAAVTDVTYAILYDATANNEKIICMFPE